MIKEINREHFEHWLERQPDERVFNYCSNGHCVLGKFIRETYNLEPFVGAGLIMFFKHPNPTIELEEWMISMLRICRRDWKNTYTNYIPAKRLKKVYAALFPAKVVPIPELRAETPGLSLDVASLERKDEIAEKQPEILVCD